MSGKLDGKRVRIVLYEGQGAQRLEDARRLETLTALLEDGHPVTRPASREFGNAGAVSPSDESDHLVLGQFDQKPARAEGDAGGTLEFGVESDRRPPDRRPVP